MLSRGTSFKPTDVFMCAAMACLTFGLVRLFFFDPRACRMVGFDARTSLRVAQQQQLRR